MNNLINKEYALKTLFADESKNWMRQAIGFNHVAKVLIKANTIQDRKYIATHEIYLSYFTVKQACYLQAHAIELCLKALCCLFKATDEHTENFSPNHDLKPLIEKLIQQKVLFNDQYNKYEKTIKLANLFLRWLGRYFRPRQKELTGAFIKDFLEEVQHIDQNTKVPVVMVRNKYITDESYSLLTEFYNFLSEIFNKKQPIFLEDIGFWVDGLF